MTDEDSEPKKCFAILPIGSSGSDARRRSNHIYKYVIADSLVPLGYSTTRADTLDQSGQITTQIIDNLLKADLVVADLSDLNANVFYELAVRHAIGKPFIHIMAEGQSPPFDVQGMRTIYVDTTNLDSVHEAKQSVVNTVQAIKDGTEIDTPLRQTIDIQSLRQSENSESRGIADIIREVGLLRRAMAGGQRPRNSTAAVDGNDFSSMREFIEFHARTGRFSRDDMEELIRDRTSQAHDMWVNDLKGAMQASGDPWASATPAASGGGYDDEPPF